MSMIVYIYIYIYSVLSTNYHSALLLERCIGSLFDEITIYIAFAECFHLIYERSEGFWKVKHQLFIVIQVPLLKQYTTSTGTIKIFLLV